jgi:site-specific recombinase XerD
MDETPTCIPAATAPLAHLAPSVDAYIGAARAASTRHIYRSDWAQFTAWCAAQGVPSLPAHPATVAAYLSQLADAGLKASTITRKVSAIKFAHTVAVVDDPTTHPLVTTTAAGIRRRIGVAPQGKAPACTEQVRMMLATLRTDLQGLRNAALLLLGFATASRRSELVGLNVEDITFCPEGMMVLVRWSKTDQEGAGINKGVPYGTVQATCPVRALIAYLAAAEITTGPLFRKVDRHGHLGAGRLSGQSVALIVKAAAQAAGLDPRVYAGHSLRAGLATSAAQAGVEERLIMQQGGWKTERMVRRYIRDGNLFRENAAGQVGL